MSTASLLEVDIGRKKRLSSEELSKIKNARLSEVYKESMKEEKKLSSEVSHILELLYPPTTIDEESIKEEKKDEEFLRFLSVRDRARVHRLVTRSSLEQLYTLRRPEEVRRFLDNNTFLYQLLHEANQQIRNYFESKELILEVVTDPEEGEQELVIWIHTNLSADEAYKKLKEFDNNWWLNVPPNISEKLSINVEF